MKAAHIFKSMTVTSDLKALSLNVVPTFEMAHNIQ